MDMDKIFALNDLLDKVRVQINAIGQTGEDEFDAGCMLIQDSLKLAKPMIDRGAHVLFTQDLWQKMGEQN